MRICALCFSDCRLPFIRAWNCNLLSIFCLFFNTYCILGRSEVRIRCLSRRMAIVSFFVVFLKQIMFASWHNLPNASFTLSYHSTKKKNSMALVRKRTTPTERPPLVGEVSANFSGQRVSRRQRNESPLLPFDRIIANMKHFSSISMNI
jgi:hypothetical protein